MQLPASRRFAGRGRARIPRRHGSRRERPARDASRLRFAGPAARANLEERARRTSLLQGRQVPPWDMLAAGRFGVAFRPKTMRSKIVGDRASVEVLGADPQNERATVSCVREVGGWRIRTRASSAVTTDLPAPAERAVTALWRLSSGRGSVAGSWCLRWRQRVCGGARPVRAGDPERRVDSGRPDWASADISLRPLPPWLRQAPLAPPPSTGVVTIAAPPSTAEPSPAPAPKPLVVLVDELPYHWSHLVAKEAPERPHASRAKRGHGGRPYHPGPGIVVDTTEDQGGPGTADLQRVARSAGYWPFRRCYEEGLRRDPGLAGKYPSTSPSR